MKRFDLDDRLTARPTVTPESGLQWSKVFKYSELVAHVIAIVEGVGNLAPGAVQDLEEVEIRQGGKEYVWDMGHLTRKK